MLKAQNLHKSYGKLEILKGVDLHVKTGEVVSIVGASGAGKSTLLHIVGTLDNADNGSLIIDNIDVSKLNSRKISEFRNQKIGFIFQFHHLLPEFTALENVCIPAFIAKQSRKEAEKYAHELLELLGLSHRLQHKPTELSGGEQQRVAVARALINKPAILLADEPSGNLDSANAKELHQLFFDLRDRFNQTIVVVTHNEELAGMADRELLMKDGKIVYSHETVIDQ
ncbi:ABC transporter ATP-binding protein [Solitalea canadensis]|uniref:ABC-type antimicrobial peptide transport system, ATPase component n=1 Tax=Solitalea canadensis (strain ATCC 29591 / DSM 3403 / JCM 21819 / LMG 8368 / NBRC 15130 / NCIMB 12057 / USAM 9D) TaxID=929556 RepID=H8KQ82_SOLCM|nr:ABC transporter ATP-binding protein [Solitalea canadensis]AFD06377.1 ABC-type antimicrobial peptide transport system, ATPase component [Solitalea canadensis DSM 3403]